MKYFSFRFLFDCSAEKLQPAKDLLADMSAECGFESFEDSENGFVGFAQQPLVDEEALNQLLADFPIPDVKIAYQKEAVEDQNWNQEWERQGFEPINIDDKIIVFDAKHGIIDQPAGCIVIGIDAVQAFGTGTHHTTQMMVRALSAIDLNHQSVLDCGSGTGILGLAASKLGAERVVGFDIDEWSVNNARHNAQLNGVDNLSVLHGDASVISHISGLFGVVVANINRNILLADMPCYVDAMGGKAHLVVSGFYQEDIPMLLEKAQTLGLREIRRFNQENWACLILQRQ